jgi:dsRNA-specific ribonuclease
MAPIRPTVSPAGPSSNVNVPYHPYARTSQTQQDFTIQPQQYQVEIPYQPQPYQYTPQPAHLPARPSPEVTALAAQQLEAQRRDVKPNIEIDTKPDSKPVLDLKPNVHTVVAPLPSKRAKLRSTSKAQLIPVDQLPVFPLPPLPVIESAELMAQVFSHSSLFTKVKGRFEMVEETDYEKLEHVGDSILGMVITTWLHETKPLLTIGTATVSRSF